MSILYKRHRVRKAADGLEVGDPKKDKKGDPEYDYSAIENSYKSLNEELTKTKDPDKKEAISSRMVALKVAMQNIKHYYKYGKEYGSYYNTPGVQAGLTIAAEGKDWLQNWIRDPEYRKRLVKLRGTTVLDDASGWVGEKTGLFEGTDQAGDWADKVIKKGLDNIDNTRVYINPENPTHSMDVANDIFKTTSNSDRMNHIAMRKPSLQGAANRAAKAIIITNNIDSKDISSVLSHELTHSSGLDLFYNRNLLGISDLRRRVNTRLRVKYGPGSKYVKDSFGLTGYTTPDGGIQTDLDSIYANVGYKNSKLINYIDSSEEVYPRIMNIRYMGNFKPGEMVTQGMLDKVKEKYREELFDLYSDEQILEMLNTFASNDPGAPRDITTQGTRVARKGLKFQRRGLLY